MAFRVSPPTHPPGAFLWTVLISSFFGEEMGAEKIVREKAEA